MRGKRWRRAGTALIVLGVLALGYGAAVYFWHDPVTDLYNRWKQNQLAGELDRTFAEFQASQPQPPTEDGALPPPTTGEDASSLDAPPTPAVDVQAEVRDAGRAFARQLEDGDALGRISIPKLDVDSVFVHGTESGDLQKGPGHYPETSLPALGPLTAIAGHRTTFGAPFRHIDELERGDRISLELPYGTFEYEVVKHEIVDDEDWSIIEPGDEETLVLSACHPLFSASQRWVVFARLVEEQTPDGDLVALLPPGDTSLASSG